MRQGKIQAAASVIAIGAARHDVAYRHSVPRSQSSTRRAVDWPFLPSPSLGSAFALPLSRAALIHLLPLYDHASFLSGYSAFFLSLASQPPWRL